MINRNPLICVHKPVSASFVGVVAVTILSSLVYLKQPTPSPGIVKPLFGQGIYADDPGDSWNRIFHCLFSRTVKTHLSSDFPGGAPFDRVRSVGLVRGLSVSKRLSEREEIGDRAIEPLYPSFITSAGATQTLTEPLHSELTNALKDAIAEEKSRPSLARALMQTDLWGAYDVLFNTSFTETSGRQFREKRNQLLALLARLIKKIALTPIEIDSLPDNYAAAAKRNQLPRLFDQNSGWIEVQWHPVRLHDESADFRRTARVFIKPASHTQDTQEFIDGLAQAQRVASKLEATALVTQNLLIDSNGRAAPSPLTYDVQIRRFVKDVQGTLVRTEVEEQELSRRLLLSRPESGGLVGLDEKAPAYLPEAGNDYGFASLQRNRQTDGSPILVNLRSRCTACHGQNVATVFTFSTNSPPPFPPVLQLNPSDNDRALLVAHSKAAREDFRSLLTQFLNSN